MKPRQRGVFGGSSGVWILKRRNKTAKDDDDGLIKPTTTSSRLSFESSDDTDSSSSSVLSPCLQSKNRVSEEPQDSSKIALSNNKTKRPVSWTQPQKKRRKGVFGVRKTVLAFANNNNETNSSDEPTKDTEPPTNILTNSSKVSDEEPPSDLSQTSTLTFKEEPRLHASLEAAKTFFATIDADPTLLPCSSRASPKAHYPTRRGKLPTQMARAEYKQYQTLCTETRVKPLSFAKFSDQRHRYFRRNQVYEGMFDD